MTAQAIIVLFGSAVVIAVVMAMAYIKTIDLRAAMTKENHFVS
jgi:hypothetical protein